MKFVAGVMLTLSENLQNVTNNLVLVLKMIQSFSRPFLLTNKSGCSLKFSAVAANCCREWNAMSITEFVMKIL